MNMMKSLLFWSLMTLLFIALAATGWKTWEQAVAYEQQTLLIIEQLGAETQLENSGRQLLEALSFGLYDGYSQTLDQISELKQRQSAYQQSVYQLTLIFIVIAGSILALAGLARRNLGDLGYAMLTVATVALVVGLTTPILSIEASKELPVLGETVLQFQSKGIMTTIVSLKEHDDLWLAALLFIFSVLLPLLKTSTAWLTLFSTTHHISLKGLHLSQHIGKWSMADVFVVAILVAFFSSNGSGLTEAEVQAGLWFFSIYVLLSLLGTQLISVYLRQYSDKAATEKSEKELEK